MATARTIDAAIAATLEAVEEALSGGAEAIAGRAVAEEAFAEIAAAQLLTLTMDSLLERTSWPGYHSLAVSRRLLDAFQTNCNRWEPAWSLCVTNAALAISMSCDHSTPALLFEGHKHRATALTVLGRFDDAFRSLDEAEAFAADTNDVRLHDAMLAHARAAACCHMGRWQEALAFLDHAQDGFAACGATMRLEQSRACEGAALFGLKRYDDARHVFTSGLKAAVTLGNDELMIMSLGNIGDTYVMTGDVQSARKHLNRSSELSASLGWRGARARVQTTLGVLDIRERGADGRQRLEEASAELERLGMDSDWVDARVDLAEGLVSVDRTADVSEICREAYERAIALGISGLAERALALLERGSVPRSGTDNPM